MAKKDTENSDDLMEDNTKMLTAQELEDMKNVEWEEEHSKRKTRLSFRKIPFLKILISLVIISAVGAGSFFGYRYYSAWKSESVEYPELEFEKIELNHDVLRFIFENITECYSGFITINNEIILIEKEIDRISGIEKKYPNQIKITSLEKKNWIKLKSDLIKTLNKLESESEQLYVSYMVNKERGLELVAKQKESMLKAVQTSLVTVEKETNRLKTEKTYTGFFKYYYILKDKLIN